MPSVFAAIVFANQEAEVLAMVVLVVGEVVEYHAAIHLLHGVSESTPTSCPWYLTVSRSIFVILYKLLFYRYSCIGLHNVGWH